VYGRNGTDGIHHALVKIEHSRRGNYAKGTQAGSPQAGQ
jgi:hypothetical protein